MSTKTTKRVRESPVQEPDEPEKVTPKRAKTQVRGFTKNNICDNLCSRDHRRYAN